MESQLTNLSWLDSTWSQFVYRKWLWDHNTSPLVDVRYYVAAPNCAHASRKSFVNQGMQRGVGYGARISLQNWRHMLRSSSVSFGTGSSSLVSKFLPQKKRTTQVVSPQTLGEPKHKDPPRPELLSPALPGKSASSPRAEIQNIIKKGGRPSWLCSLHYFCPFIIYFPLLFLSVRFPGCSTGAASS